KVKVFMRLKEAVIIAGVLIPSNHSFAADSVQAAYENACSKCEVAQEKADRRGQMFAYRECLLGIAFGLQTIDEGNSSSAAREMCKTTTAMFRQECLIGVGFFFSQLAGTNR
ncbi:MAG: hypothetical protein NDI61_00225, partial [Bdellovibrionaceae bacterium]|nr:hypothetical protein [Pseudobdellovibrionaceae bacterium]